jgi:hypothetical protein
MSDPTKAREAAPVALSTPAENVSQVGNFLIRSL